MMKKLISILAITLALVMGTSALAQTTSTKSDRLSKLQQAQQKIEQREEANQTKATEQAAKKAQLSAFRAALQQDRATVLENQKKNQKILEDNKTLRHSIAASIETIKEKGITLSDETIATLKADNEKISAIWADIKTTKGQVKAIAGMNKGVVKNKDYSALDANFQKIYTLQNWRNEQLTEINTILQQMNKLLTDSITAYNATTTTAAATTTTATTAETTATEATETTAAAQA